MPSVDFHADLATSYGDQMYESVILWGSGLARQLSARKMNATLLQPGRDVTSGVTLGMELAMFAKLCHALAFN